MVNEPPQKPFRSVFGAQVLLLSTLIVVAPILLAESYAVFVLGMSFLLVGRDWRRRVLPAGLVAAAYIALRYLLHPRLYLHDAIELLWEGSAISSAYTSCVVSILQALPLKLNINWIENNTLLVVGTHEFGMRIGYACTGVYGAFMFLIAAVYLLSKMECSRLSAAKYLGTGLLGVVLLNIIRLSLTGIVGAFYGYEVACSFHTYAGGVLFLALIAPFSYWISKKQR